MRALISDHGASRLPRHGVRPRLRQPPRVQGRAPAWTGGRRVAPPREFLLDERPAAPIELPALRAPALGLATAALLALADVMALKLAHPLVLPLYMATLALCTLAVAASLWPDAREDEAPAPVAAPNRWTA